METKKEVNLAKSHNNKLIHHQIIQRMITKKHIEEGDGRRPNFVSLTNSGLQAMFLGFKVEKEQNNKSYEIYCSPDVYFEFKKECSANGDKNKLTDLLIESPAENVSNVKPGFIYTDVIADIKHQFALRKEAKIEDRPLTLLMDTSMHALGNGNLSVLLNEFKSNLDDGSLKIIVAHSFNKYNQVGLDTLGSGCFYVFGKPNEDFSLKYGSGLASYLIDNRTPQIITHMLMFASNHLRAFENFATKRANVLYTQYGTNLVPKSEDKPFDDDKFITIDNPNHNGPIRENLQSSELSFTGRIHKYLNPRQHESKEEKNIEHYTDPHLNSSWGFLCLRNVDLHISQFLRHFIPQRAGFAYAETTFDCIEYINIRISLGTESYKELIQKLEPTLQLCKALNYAKAKNINYDEFIESLQADVKQSNQISVLDYLYLLEKKSLLRTILKAAQEGNVAMLQSYPYCAYLFEVKNIFGMSLDDIVTKKLIRDPNNFKLIQTKAFLSSQLEQGKKEEYSVIKQAFIAASQGILTEEIKKLSYLELSLLKNEEGNSLAVVAAQCNQMNLLKELKQCGIDLHEEKDNENNSLISIAAKQGHIKLLQALGNLGFNMEQEALIIADIAIKKQKNELLLFLDEINFDLSKHSFKLIFDAKNIMGYFKNANKNEILKTLAEIALKRKYNNMLEDLKFFNFDLSQEQEQEINLRAF